MSVKAALIITWTLFIAGAAIASENHRLCTQEHETKLQRLQEARPHDDNTLSAGHAAGVVAQVHVTN